MHHDTRSPLPQAPATDLGAEDIGRWMAEHDLYAKSQGMRLESAAPGQCSVSLTVRRDMLNAVGLTHGAVTYGLADFAFAVASNSHGQTAVALTTHMQYPAPSREGDTLQAVAREENLGRQTAAYRVEVRRGDGTLVGLFSGTVFRRGDRIADWIQQIKE
jgi:acyl-CoA thioesterase